MSFEILENSIVQIQPIIRGSNREHKFNTYESAQTGILFTDLDVTTQITFELKKDFYGGVIFTKKNQAAGGGDTQIYINSSSNFSIFFSESDTEDLVIFNYKGIIIIELSNGRIYKKYLEIPII